MHEGQWRRLRTNPELKSLLPPRHGARIETHFPEQGGVAYQIWYPPNAPDDQKSKLFHNLEAGVQWAYARHKKFLFMMGVSG
eukprot:10834589-Karenia_brevis.AAC.1